MSENGKLEGITLNGVPLVSCVEKIYDPQITKEVFEVLDESKREHHLYHPGRLKFQSAQEKGHGPVNIVDKVKVHQENRDNYLKIAIGKNSMREAVVAVLISADKPITTEEIFKVIKSKPIKEFDLTVHTVRTHIGRIYNGNLGQFIEKHGRPVKYFLVNEIKERLEFLEMCKIANKNIFKTNRRTVPREDPIDIIETAKENEDMAEQPECKRKEDMDLDMARAELKKLYEEINYKLRQSNKIGVELNVHFFFHFK
jgi:hypothetical protein